MPRRPESEVVLFARGSQDSESTADDWDDTELLKEYDKAVRPLKALVAERMGLSNAELEEVSATESCASSRSAVEKETSKGHKRNQKKRHRKNRNKQHREWTVGDHCQAMYSLDNKWYEATIISIDIDRFSCIVQYVGYGNTEEQPLPAIAHSMGAAVRREQGRVASMEKKSETDIANADDAMERSSLASSSISHSKGIDSGKKKKHNSFEKFGGTPLKQFPPQPPNLDKINRPGLMGMPGFHPMMDDMVPPPLPPHVLSSLPADDSEALSAMLMSWYMSGFHTGYYQGLKRAKNSISSPLTHTNL